MEDLATELAESDDLILIDVRRPEELEEAGQIEGATHVQLETFVDQQDLWPADLDANIVIYCKAGVRGNIAATILRTYGYTNVRNLKGGFDAWVEAGNPIVGGLDLDTAFQTFLDDMEGYGVISVESLNEALAEEPPFLLDVREVSEVEENGYIEGTNALIPLRELGKNIDKLPAFDRAVVVYCGSGWRSAIAMTALEAMGWTDVKSMTGGFGAWTGAGLPAAPGLPAEAEVLNIAAPDPAVLAAVDEMLVNLPEGWGVLPVEDLATELAEGGDLILIDVRRPEEVEESGLIEGAIRIPLEEFIALMADWPADLDANIVVYCKVGHRGNIAATILRTYGYTNIRNLRGGFDAWVAGGYEAAMPE